MYLLLFYTSSSSRIEHKSQIKKKYKILNFVVMKINILPLFISLLSTRPVKLGPKTQLDGNNLDFLKGPVTMFSLSL